jgi:FtsP/CotA-like multicopper oxidase with cupredoxin domain
MNLEASMILQPIDVVVYAWLFIAVLSSLYVAYDQVRNNPEAAVMKWGFVLVTLYMGPLGLLLYVMSDKEPTPGTHEAFVRPLWKQGVGSTVHCVAGDATGIILAAAVTALLGFPMWVDVMVEYVAGFLFGLLIFQSLFMRAMMGGSYAHNVRRSFIPELLSMNCVMAGMAPVMILLMMSRDMRAMWPGEPLFWFVMSLAVVAGFIIAYPVNVWLVAQGMKHGLMTVRRHSERPATKNHEHGGHHEHASAQMDQDQAGETHAQHVTERSAGPTRPQILALTGFTILMFVAGMFVPAAFVNMRVRAEEVRGTIMPPGMIVTASMPAEAMRDMAAADPRRAAYTPASDERGDRVLAPHVEDGVKVFDLEASVIRWNILPGTQVTAYAINRQVPGPRLEFQEGDRVRINFTNHLPEPATMHWHGLVVPNRMDGVGSITQDPVPPGGHYAYEYVALQSGTFFYHSHTRADRQQTLGLYGALIIRPPQPTMEPHADYEYVVQLQEWLYRDGLTYPAMLMEGGLPNYFTINGKAFPATDTLHMRVGETIKLRIIGTHNNFIHPMHMHGGPFTVIARDGVLLAEGARFEADVLNIGPGQRYDVIWPAREPGKWLFHCHIPHHTLNNNVEERGGGGLTLIVDVAP